MRQLKNPEEVLITLKYTKNSKDSEAKDWTQLAYPYAHFVPRSTERENLNFEKDSIVCFPNNNVDPLVIQVTQEEGLVQVDPEKLDIGSTEYGDPEILKSSISTLVNFASNAIKCKYVRSCRVDKNSDGDLVQTLFHA